MKKFFYRVKEGDTLFSLCEKYSVPQTEIVKLNGLKQEISEGDVLYFEIVDSPVYRVDVCDTVRSLSEKFNVPEEYVKEQAGSDYLFYGLKLRI